jgi:hypothetical protein
MSLTRHLKQPGPIRDWFTESFPHTQETAGQANRRLRGGHPVASTCEVAPPAGSDVALVGTAVEYILRAHLRAGAWERTVASRGAAMLDLSDRAIGGFARQAELAAIQCAEQLAPSRRTLAAGEREQLLGAAIVLARLEQVFRAGERVRALVAPAFHKHGAELGALARELANEPTVADLSGLAAATIADHGELRESERLALGPNFVQSVPLGGADADLIADGLLLDFKSTTQASIVGRPELWQLIGYLLADTEDEYAIRSVGIAALRWRRWIGWPVEQLLAVVSGRERPLEEWREEFGEVVARAPGKRQRIPRRRAQALVRVPGQE